MKHNSSEYNDFSKKKLSNAVKKRFDTTIIGTLSIFENFFGHLWGHGLHYDQLTDDQKDFRSIWEEVRTKILDHGNNHSRGAMNEISNYTISWNRYVMNFVFRNRGD
jgi:hypothetical protein